VKTGISLVLIVSMVVLISLIYYSWGSHLSWHDLVTFDAKAEEVGRLKGDPLDRLGLKASDVVKTGNHGTTRFLQKSLYLNNTHAVVTHTIDDSTECIIDCLNAMDRYDVKATVFVSTNQGVISQLWPRLREAIANGHEIGSHSRRHQCQWPDTKLFCFRAYTDFEITGSREDILKHTSQPYVWSWCYPCGNCAHYEFVQRKLARAGYLVARNYPGEERDLHNLPNLQTYDSNPYDATYTQVVQKKGGIAKSGRTNVAELNAKFDEVYERGGIYNFLSHPQWLDYGTEKFYEQHLVHLGKRSDVWYVPMGPLYAYQTIRERTDVQELKPARGSARYAVYNDLDDKIFNGVLTLEFSVPGKSIPYSHGTPIPEWHEQLTDRWQNEYFRREGDKVFVTIHPNTILEFL
jgi:peptidoglycan/xylan/chitin deacetylase (PgdA/CDA1 family)